MEINRLRADLILIMQSCICHSAFNQTWSDSYLHLSHFQFYKNVIIAIFCVLQENSNTFILILWWFFLSKMLLIWMYGSLSVIFHQIANWLLDLTKWKFLAYIFCELPGIRSDFLMTFMALCNIVHIMHCWSFINIQWWRFSFLFRTF